MSDTALPRVMGIINCTPDSFFPGSRGSQTSAAVERAKLLADQGADILDIGGESTRPGAPSVSEDEELRRVLPVIRAIREFSDLPLSIDTRKAAVARAAMDTGADMVNDVSALADDPAMASLVAERGVPVVLMHMKGQPETMQDRPYYDDVVKDVKETLLQAVHRATTAGIHEDRIILDPGIGFGKRQQDNVKLLQSLPDLAGLGYPLLVGLSRKSFLGAITGRDVEDRGAATLGAHIWCLHQGLGGRDILRVHDVQETVDALKVWEAFSCPS